MYPSQNADFGDHFGVEADGVSEEEKAGCTGRKIGKKKSHREGGFEWEKKKNSY